MCCKDFQAQLQTDRSHCFENSNVAREKKKEFRLEKTSKQQVCKVRVDGCLIEAEDRTKCDFMFKACGTEIIYLVELKGSNIDQALEQIISTFTYIKDRLKNGPENYKCHIVSKGVPKANRYFATKQKEFRRKYNLDVKRHTDSAKVIFGK